MVRNRVQMGEKGRQDHKNWLRGLKNLVLHATASSGDAAARNSAFKRNFVLDARLIPRWRISINPWCIG